MSHVKLFVNHNCQKSLSDTELPEDYVQQILDVNPTQQAPQRSRRQTQILRGQLLAMFDGADAPLQ
jgi:hypothetical protein